MTNRPQMQMNFKISRTVKILIWTTIGVWLVGQLVLEKGLGISFTKLFALSPYRVMFEFSIWQLGTYMFTHASNVMHITFNMIMLWWLGTELEQRWGGRFFLAYYLLTGMGAAIIYCLVLLTYSLIKGGDASLLMIPVVGASGSIFGLLLAYGILFGERMAYLFGFFPMKAKHMVMILGAVELASIFSSGPAGGDVANLAHLGGLISGFLILWGWTRLQRLQWNQKAKKRQSKLKLVVDNEKPKSGEGPKYWN